MRALNASLIVLFATASSLALSGCLGTNTPTSPPALINESASGTGYIAVRGAGFDTMTTTVSGGHMAGGAIDADGSDVGSTNAVFTAYTNSGNGNYGFIANLPGDATPAGITSTPTPYTPDTAVINLNGGFTSITSTTGVFPAGTEYASIATDTLGSVSLTTGTGGTPDGGNILVDKFGAVPTIAGGSGLQDSEYGIWSATGTTPGISATQATTAGVFAIGIPTTIMPTTGSAQYIGGAAGIATNAAGGGEFAGTAVLNATFTVGGGTISGFITGPGDTTNLVGHATAIPYSSATSATAGAITGTMNAINLPTGTIAGNTFAGTASAIGNGSAAPNNIAIDSATGTFGGAFNGGLTAAEVAGTFKLAGGSGPSAGTSVIGAFGAKIQ